EQVVEQLAADEGHGFAASYVARRAGIPTEEAYRQLEALAQRGDLDRRFELISPTTGRSLVEYRLGDTVPSGCVYEPEYEDEEPFVITDNDIWITFAPTATLRTRVEHKKNCRSRRRESSSGCRQRCGRRWRRSANRSRRSWARYGRKSSVAIRRPNRDAGTRNGRLSVRRSGRDLAGGRFRTQHRADRRALDRADRSTIVGAGAAGRARRS